MLLAGIAGPMVASELWKGRCVVVRIVGDHCRAGGHCRADGEWHPKSLRVLRGNVQRGAARLAGALMRLASAL